MTEQTARQFVDALNRLEREHDAEPIAMVFAEDCEVGNVVAHAQFRGRDGARSFWKKYRDAFGDVQSTFRNIIVTADRAALEWVTEGTSHDGDPIRYSGVTILEMQGDSIVRCRAYFDADELGRQLAGHGRREASAYI